MQISFETDSKVSVRVIPKIAAHSKIWLEGYNGIGKTMAARFLEIAFGQHYFLSTDELNSILKSVHQVKAFCTIPTEDKILEADITPNSWEIADDGLHIKSNHAEYKFGDTVISRDDALKKLNVRIVRGNETLRSQVLELLNQSVRRIENLIGRCEKRGESLKTFLNQYNEDFGYFKIVNLKKLTKELEDLQIEEKENIEYQKILSEAIKVKEQLELINKSLETHSLGNIEELGEDINNIGLEIQKIIADQQNKKDELQAIEESITKKPVIDEKIRNLWTRRSKRNKELNESKQKLRRYLAEINLDIEFKEQFNSKKANRMLRDYVRSLGNELDNAGNEKILSKKAHDARHYANMVKVSCHKAITREIGDYTLLKYNNDELSFRQVEDLVSYRIDEIDKDPIISKGKEDLEQLEDHLARLQEFANKSLREIRNYDQIYKEIVSYSSRIAGIEIPEMGDLQQRQEDLEKQVDEFESNLYERHKKKNALEALLLEIQDLDTEELLREKKSELIDIQKSEKFQQISDKNLKREQILTEGKYQVIKEELFNLKDVIRGSSYKISSLRDLNQEKSIYKFLNLDTDLEGGEWWEEVEKGYITIQMIDEEVMYLFYQLSLLYRDLRSLRNPKKRTEYSVYMPGIMKAFNHVLINIYNKDTFIEHVFKPYTILDRFNIEDNSITFLVDNKPVIRSLDAFSTGEKAFAFSIAMMKIFSFSAEYNVLILDEFGALLDYIKQDALWNQLTSEILQERIADKVIVMLPAREDFSGEPITHEKLISEGYIQRESPKGSLL